MDISRVTDGASIASVNCSDGRRGLSKVNTFHWGGIESELSEQGCAILPELFSLEVCQELTGLYKDDTRFRSHITMSRHGFGKGEYKYFAYPLPEPVAELRCELYARLAPIANRWNERMRLDFRYPREHRGFLAQCHAMEC